MWRGQCACELCTRVSRAKTDEPIEMLSGRTLMCAQEILCNLVKSRQKGQFMEVSPVIECKVGCNYKCRPHILRASLCVFVCAVSCIVITMMMNYAISSFFQSYKLMYVQYFRYVLRLVRAYCNYLNLKQFVSLPANFYCH